MSDNDADLVAEFLQHKSVTKCPPGTVPVEYDDLYDAPVYMNDSKGNDHVKDL